MRVLRLLPLCLLFALGCQSTASAPARGELLAHDVYFELVDGSPEACKTLVRACEKKLAKLPGIVFFAAGRRNEEVTAEVNDQTYDVSLHIYFEDRAALDAYLVSPDHVGFIEDQRGNWLQVRVFDSDVEAR